MSASVRTQADDRNIELGSAVNWPPIVAAAGLGLAVLIAVVVLGIATATAPKTESVVAQQTVVPAPDQDTFLPAQPDTPPQPDVVVESTTIPAKPSPLVKTNPAQSFKQYSLSCEAKLRDRLYSETRELNVETVKGTTTTLLREVDKKPQPKTPSLVELIAKRADLKGLPVREVDKCKVSAKEAKIMAEMSSTVRTVRAKSGRRGSSSSFSQTYANYLETSLREPEWHEDTGVRLMVQMLQVEEKEVRRRMVALLAENKEKRATVALAQRAVFDLNPDVRMDAIIALNERPRAEVRPVLVEALRYPWAPVADNAVEALVALNDREAVAELVSLLDTPDPQAPFQNKDKKWVVAELVQVNHLGNCVLCHAPCSKEENTVRGVVPVRGRSLVGANYESEEGPFVRADVTYLKQDFSVMQPVAKPGGGPVVQRFDYLIRQRELSDDEVKCLEQAKKGETVTPKYPQREAILWALRELTGKDIGARSEDWNHYIQSMKTERMKCAP